ncbi:hypothetical protein CpB1059 [Chlamydia pneumoniae TW-183]|uniref:Uncharacterized protein n=1 Tax=Chlamydia pneumoniae TaxID=83558 RepID=A0ABN3YQN2_CHLPN|nr:hypothetical protein CpB1059 [Chlamydia pneumoniae TW-183]
MLSCRESYLYFCSNNSFFSGISIYKNIKLSFRRRSRYGLVRYSHNISSVDLSS